MNLKDFLNWTDYSQKKIKKIRSKRTSVRIPESKKNEKSVNSNNSLEKLWKRQTINFRILSSPIIWQFLAKKYLQTENLVVLSLSLKITSWKKFPLGETWQFGLHEFELEAGIFNPTSVCHYLVSRVAFPLYPQGARSILHGKELSNGERSENTNKGSGSLRSPIWAWQLWYRSSCQYQRH